MKQLHNVKLWIALGFLMAFALWTAALCLVDVRPIGPQGTLVGMATINDMFHRLTGVCMPIYTITDWLGLIPVAVCFVFALMGLVQWIRRGHIAKVDFSLLALGVFYLVMLAVYLLFETVVINYRPVLIQGRLEVSYPSSTTLLTLCVMPTTMFQLRHRVRRPMIRRCIMVVILLFMVFMVGGRLLAGVHWLTDIVGGGLLAAGLVTLYDALCQWQRALSKTPSVG